MHSPKRFSRYANYFNGQNIGPKYRYCMFLKEIKFSYQKKLSCAEHYLTGGDFLLTSKQ